MYTPWTHTHTLVEMAIEADGTHSTGMHSCYRPQRSWGKVIFSEACVNNSVQGGMHGCSGGVHGFIRGACMVLFGGMHGFIRGGVRGFIQGGVHGFIQRGGMCGFIQLGACVVLFSGGACVVFSVFRIQ